jgi:hypothetical protein
MKTLTTLFALAIFCATGYGQTIKSLGFNTTNGEVVYTGTNAMIFTNGFSLVDGETTVIDFATDALSNFFYGIAVGSPIEFSGTNAVTAAATTRTNLGLALPALTNTSNADMLSALGAAQTIFTVKTNDQTIIDETNATSITDLTFATEPGARYVVTFFPIIEASEASTALQVVATNATAYGNWNGLGVGSSGIVEATNEATFGSTTARSPLQTFYVEGSTNAGSISVTFRSTVATNTNTIKAGSFLRADKMP